MRRIAALALAGGLLVWGIAPVRAQTLSDWQRAQQLKAWKDEAVKLPAYPVSSNLVRVAVGAVRGFEFFVDSTSISVLPDGVVRYTLVARSASGTENVGYEGMHCRNATYKVYAFGGSDAKWHVNGDAKWRAVARGGAMPWRAELQRDFWCRGGLEPADTAAAVAALRRGPPATGGYESLPY